MLSIQKPQKLDPGGDSLVVTGEASYTGLPICGFWGPRHCKNANGLRTNTQIQEVSEASNAHSEQ
jgi:hypothetical protein